MVKRTLQEIANFFDMAVAVDESGLICAYRDIPLLQRDAWISYQTNSVIPRCLVDYSDDWRESLAVPDSWPREPKFREGELVIGKATGMVAKWGYGVYDEKLYRRPTEAEWKVLKGEE